MFLYIGQYFCTHYKYNRNTIFGGSDTHPFPFVYIFQELRLLKKIRVSFLHGVKKLPFYSVNIKPFKNYYNNRQ